MGRTLSFDGMPRVHLRAVGETIKDQSLEMKTALNANCFGILQRMCVEIDSPHDLYI